MVEVSIITPVWNKSGITHKFLHHNWLLYQNRPEVEFVIVNNGSTDNTRLILSRWVKIMGDQLQIKHLPENTGFGAGHNAGAEIARGDILVFLSNDVTAFGDYVTAIKQMVRDDILIGAELLNHDTGWNSFGGKIYGYLTGWCIAANRATWDKLGGWDERYFPCDYEDIDLSLTAKKLGIELLQVRMPLQHAFGQSAASLNGGRTQYTIKNRRRFREKWSI